MSSSETVVLFQLEYIAGKRLLVQIDSFSGDKYMLELDHTNGSAMHGCTCQPTLGNRKPPAHNNTRHTTSTQQHDTAHLRTTLTQQPKQEQTQSQHSHSATLRTQHQAILGHTTHRAAHTLLCPPLVAFPFCYFSRYCCYLLCVLFTAARAVG